MDKFVIAIAVVIWLVRTVLRAAAEQEKPGGAKPPSGGASTDDWGGWEPVPAKPLPPGSRPPGPKPVVRPLHAPAAAVPPRPVPPPPAPRQPAPVAAAVRPPPPPRRAETAPASEPKPGGTLAHLQTHQSTLRAGGTLAGPKIGKLGGKNLSAAFPRGPRKAATSTSRRSHPLLAELRGRRNLLKGILLQEILSRPRAFDV